MQYQKDDFTKRLQNYLSDTKIRNKPIEVCNTPNALLAIGAKQLPIVMNPNDIDKCLAERTAKNKNNHNLSTEELCMLPELFANPVLILRTKNRAGYITIITEKTDKNMNPIIIGMELDIICGNQNTNRIASMYARENAINSFVAKNGEIVNGFIPRMIIDGNLLAYNKQKASTFFHLQEIISIREDDVVTFDNSIVDSLDSVNSFL